MGTNISEFMKYHRLIMNGDTRYINEINKQLVKDLKICKCIESFIYDELLIKEGNIYLFRIKNSNFLCIYELTGLWKTHGHEGNILTYKAVSEGLKGWNVPNKYLTCLKEVNLCRLNSFLYWRDE